MKNNPENDKEISQSDSESKKIESSAETEEKKAMVFNTFQEPM